MLVKILYRTATVAWATELRDIRVENEKILVEISVHMVVKPLKRETIRFTLQIVDPLTLDHDHSLVRVF
ncbi:hypothetical protein Agabi119p4_11050 [Agaricus bisporus var. burnettii]|uniref:Uncharacterized protein n=1 Tax=Agaricus bisporus var. burnettii TaxID=192524 RepID=A0A8H7EVS3_AGABI|nr:hypothetical protein Agabi119p4_11050 [Agaricus bisporus var. burnettii]